MASWTPYPELNAVLARLVAGVGAALGDFVAACLQGSFAVGDFDEDSDVDFVVVTEGELTPGEVEALQELHAGIYDLPSPWARHLEGSYFPRDVLARLDRAGEELWYLDHGARALVRSPHCNTVVVRWTVREHGVPLAGESPAALVEPVPASVLEREIRSTISDWGEEILSEPGRYANRFYQSLIVLSYCRMLHSLHTGRVASKRAGADWAKAALDPRWADLIDDAWPARHDPFTSVRTPADPVAFARTLDFVRQIIEGRLP